MKKAFVLFFLGMAAAIGTTYADQPAYRIFNSNGEVVDYQKMMEELNQEDLVFFGEIHNNPIAHWLQLELTIDLHQKKGDQMMLGAEMFEADNQLIINEYLNGTIREKDFKQEAKLWDNYITDYRPLIEHAKEYDLPFIATNIPRRYASLVARGGLEVLDSLTREAKKFVAPLPIPYDPELPGYKKMLKMSHMPGMNKPTNLPQAQAVKDATMAHFILKHMKADGFFLHFNGTYHSNNKEGIVWYIRQYAARIKVATIATVQQDQLTELATRHEGLADFILVVPQNMTTTH